MNQFSDNLDRANSELTQEWQTNNSLSITRTTEYADRMMRHITSNASSNGILSDAIRTAIINGETELVRTEFEYLKKALITVRKTQLQTLEESANVHLIQIKTNLRTRNRELLDNRILETLKHIDKKFEDLMIDIDEKLEKALKLKSSKVREDRIKQLEMQLESFMEYQEKSIKALLSIASEGL